MNILHIIPWYGGGIASIVKKLVVYSPKNMQNSIALFINSEEFNLEMKQLGVNVIKLKPKKEVGALRYFYELLKMIKNGNFDVVHVHLVHKSYIAIIGAWIARVGIIACHAHAANYGKQPSFIDKIELIINRVVAKLICKRLFTCSDLATNFLYGNVQNDSRVSLVKNGVDDSVYQPLSLNRYKNFYSEFGLTEDTLLIGHVGQFSFAKNHEFIIKIAKAMTSLNVEFRIFFAGTGKRYQEIKRKVALEGLEDKIYFLDYRDDINDLLKIWDVFLFPSRYEGLPTVIIEAQACKLPCVLSDTITSQCDLGLGLLKFLSLDDSPETWAKNVIELSRSKILASSYVKTVVSKRGFYAKEVAKSYYDDLQSLG